MTNVKVRVCEYDQHQGEGVCVWEDVWGCISEGIWEGIIVRVC